jgi:ankyrin repeat protein
MSPASKDADREPGQTELVDEFLEHACLSYGNDDWPSKWRRAERLRKQHPELARANLSAAAVSGELAHVQALLAATPALASQPGGPQRWPPLVFVCYGRIENPAAVEIATALLDAGADPNARFVMGDNDYNFTALTGVIGHGELGQPEHPRANALARLLLAHGAKPNDGQALYNTHLQQDDPHWLELLFEYGLDNEARVNWTSAGEPPRVLDYLIAQAAGNGHSKRLRSLLDHGANPNARSTYNGRSCYQAALIAGQTEIAALLVERGATPEPLTGRDAFVGACARNDATQAERLLENHRDYLDSAQPLIDAARPGNVAMVALLLKLGMNPNGEGIHGHRALHVGCKHRAVTDVLFAYGADPRSRCFGGTVAGWARHHGKPDDARYYAERSRSLLDAAMSGHVELARELLATDPTCLNERSPSGNGPLHELTDDFARASELIALLLASGADPNVKNQAGETPAQRLESLGLEEIADLLEASASA